MKIREDIETITQEICDEAKGDNKHLMIAIGWLGVMNCYIDLTLEEAKKRYLESDGSLEDVTITVFGFNDEFRTYDVSEKD